MKFRIPSWLSWYKKPEYRDFREYATNISTGKRPLSPDGRNGGIPSRLRLERILANKTCSPMSLYDFYMYLKYIEYSAENLEFYMWFKNYEAMYSKGLAIADKDYGSIPSAAQSTSSVARIKPGESDVSMEKLDHDHEDDEDSEAAQETLERISQLISTTALCTSKSSCAAAARTSFPPPIHSPTKTSKPHHLTPSTTNTTTTTKVSSTTELPTIISLFLLPNSPKELNIPPALRNQALSNLQTHGAHPVALKPVADHVYSLLRNCSHRNFVRLGVGNGTFETVCVATVLGWTTLLGGFLLVLCRAMTPFRGAHTRWEVFAAWPLWWLGMSLVLSGLRGSCFFLLLFSRRQRLPWERIGADGDGGGGLGRLGGLLRSVKRLMIFDRRIRVQEKHLRRLQRKIVLQSLTGGSVFATLCVVLFIWLPVWRETV
ncbi:hypothetical protein N657DRAFT_624751 [Parathielavia appendiculata]|uniref:RGS domain-containing protein n=1 Tax=Parathielavia appendiculata TaxID=2587402 RepID=A0AAN6Z043_9PEZI|nr:hypothetical protein N657DRAFT_624751 [Parathielavia appendiculata]